MKNIRNDNDDSLRAEYKRSDFGVMVRGKYALTQIKFAELVRLLLGCIGEDIGLDLIHYSRGNYLAGHKLGDWTYELDNANQITLRYWLDTFSSIEESISNPPTVTTAQEKSDLHGLLLNHVQALKAKVDAL
ncbi:MAG TPA: hypothetical protein VFI24_23290 [Pyrinomonadaceae bacterium]|nr:hypothetical protein [Pyrinomonadaceae bacterium]